MKKSSYIILAISALIIFLSVGIASYAWYINAIQSQTEDVDIPSNGLVVEYTIDGNEEKINPLTFTTDDVVFFDIDNEGEGYYLAGMAIPVTLKITNTTDTVVGVEVRELEAPTYALSRITENTMKIVNTAGTELDTFTFEIEDEKIIRITNTKDYIETYIDDDGKGFVVCNTSSGKKIGVCYVDEIIITLDETSAYVLETDEDSAPSITVPYVTSIIKGEEGLVESDSYKESTVEEYLADLEYTNTYTIEALEPADDKTDNDTVTLYIYLYGVQPNDAASNEFLKHNILYDITFNILAITE